VPCVVSIDTVIPQANIFRFENFWVDQPGFLDCVSAAWNIEVMGMNEASVLTRKLKFLRQALKKWKTGLSKLKLSIAKCNVVILFFDNLEEERGLFTVEENFRKVVKVHYEKLLHAQFLYWKKRCTARWMKLSEENTKYFHSMATIRFRRNNVVSLVADDGRIVSDHEEMAALALNCYKNRMGTTMGIDMCLDLPTLIKKSGWFGGSYSSFYFRGNGQCN
jgi:hypothetical protein